VTAAAAAALSLSRVHENAKRIVTKETATKFLAI
jgi:hypothetical protein